MNINSTRRNESEIHQTNKSQQQTSCSQTDWKFCKMIGEEVVTFSRTCGLE